MEIYIGDITIHEEFDNIFKEFKFLALKTK